MLRGEVYPKVTNSITKNVEEMLNLELENIRMLMGMKQKGKKKAKKKGKKNKKKKTKKGPKLPGVKMLKGMDEYDMLIDLVKNNIVKKMPPENLKDFLGEFNYIASMMEDVNDTPRPPSMALIRQIVTEFIIFPLGSPLVRKRHPENVRSFLFYGPGGTGKTQLVRAIATETRAMIYDLSPYTIQDRYNTSKNEGEKMIAMVMMSAKKYQPAVVYIDECHKIWQGKKKRKKGQKTKKKARN